MEISERTHRHIRSFYDSYGHTYQVFKDELHEVVRNRVGFSDISQRRALDLLLAAEAVACSERPA